jgi:hypothetical protein
MKTKAKKTSSKKAPKQTSAASVRATKSKFDGKQFRVVAELASKVQKESAMGQFVARGLALGTFGRNDICPPAECQTSGDRMTQTARFEQSYRKGIIVEVGADTKPKRQAKAKKELPNA